MNRKNFFLCKTLWVMASLLSTTIHSVVQETIENVAGLYGYNRHRGDESEETELSYAGCFPTKNPRYAIGVFIDLSIGIHSSSNSLWNC